MKQQQKQEGNQEAVSISNIHYRHMPHPRVLQGTTHNASDQSCNTACTGQPERTLTALRLIVSRREGLNVLPKRERD